MKNALKISDDIFDNSKASSEKIKSKILQILEEVSSVIENVKTSNFLEKTDRQDFDVSGLEKIKTMLFDRFSSIYSYSDELNKINCEGDSILKEKIKEKLSQSQRMMGKVKDLISNTKRILDGIRSNDEIKENYNNTYDELVKNMKKIQIDIKNKNDYKSVNIQEMRNRLKKLGNLYNYLKQGNKHNFIQTELLNKIVNMNQSLLNKLTLDKIIMKVDLLR